MLNKIAPLALLFGSLLAMSGCQDEPDIQARTAELAGMPGIKVTITGVELGHDKVQAIIKDIEGRAVDAGAAMVRMKKDDQGGGSIEIALYAKSLPATGSLAAELKAAFPELAGATIAAAPAEAGGGQALPIVEVSDALTAEEAKQEILGKMQADGVEGNIDVQVEDGADGRRIEVKVEKTTAH